MHRFIKYFCVGGILVKLTTIAIIKACFISQYINIPIHYYFFVFGECFNTLF